MADVQLSTLGSVIKTAYEAEANAYTDTKDTKLTGIEENADVTDTANVTAAGALMDSEVTNLAAVKAFDPTDYATAAQGATADTATQPGDDANTLGSGAATDGYVLTADGAGNAAWEAGGGGGVANPLTADLGLGGYKLTAAATTDAIVKLADNAGTYSLSVQDSDSAEVASIDSNGFITVEPDATNNSVKIYTNGTYGQIELARKGVGSTDDQLIIRGNNSSADIFYDGVSGDPGITINSNGIAIGPRTPAAANLPVALSFNDATQYEFTFQADINTTRDRDGSHLKIVGGDGGATNRSGGNVTIQGGASTGTGTDGDIIMPNLPTSDPAVAGALWVDGSNFLKVSAG